MIDSYSFGFIVINGKRYESDVIVFPEKVIGGWWRREGHKIYVEDLGEVLNHKPTPQVLVVGTGYSGLVKVMPGVEDALKKRGIKLIVQSTREAYKTFNELLKSGKPVAGAFHLTC
ncbi:MAG: Mth938-like domain-containing protein [Nitrososphaerota archaeon]|nr:Mth938-like domain-containing protein [Candidatus Bathyarchaeota archaeon]MDW8024161.1 Mth938-like domain-containing protein [Nitrososphaerota archaeon]